MHKAASKGDIKSLRKLLEKNRDPNAVNGNGQTLLHVACEHGEAVITEYLLSKEVPIPADIEALDNDGYSPLHYAAFNGSESALLSLLASHFDASTRAPDGYNALQLYVMSEIQRMSGESASESPNPHHVTALPKPPLSKSCKFSIAKKLILLDMVENGVKVNQQDEHGDSALHIACRYGQLGIAEALLCCSATVDLRNRNKETALHVAAASGNADLVNLLLLNGFDCHIKSERGLPKDIAAQQKHAEAVRLLSAAELGKFIDPNSTELIAEIAEMCLVDGVDDEESSAFKSSFSYGAIAVSSVSSPRNDKKPIPIENQRYCDRKDSPSRLTQSCEEFLENLQVACNNSCALVSAAAMKPKSLLSGGEDASEESLREQVEIIRTLYLRKQKLGETEFPTDSQSEGDPSIKFKPQAKRTTSSPNMSGSKLSEEILVVVESVNSSSSGGGDSSCLEEKEQPHNDQTLCVPTNNKREKRRSRSADAVLPIFTASAESSDSTSIQYSTSPTWSTCSPTTRNRSHHHYQLPIKAVVRDPSGDSPESRT